MPIEVTPIAENHPPQPGVPSITTIRILAGATPIADASVWVTTDAQGTRVVQGPLETNSQGQVTMWLGHGLAYYLWMRKEGVNPIMGQPFTAEAD